MAYKTYEKTDWRTGDVITEERLDKMEQGILDGQNAPPSPGSVSPEALSGYADAGRGKYPVVRADGTGFDFEAAPGGVLFGHGAPTGSAPPGTAYIDIDTMDVYGAQ